MSSPGASQHPLRCATMNVGRAAAMKLHDISYAIEGLDVVALQEIDLNVVGAPSFVAIGLFSVGPSTASTKLPSCPDSRFNVCSLNCRRLRALRR